MEFPIVRSIFAKLVVQIENSKMKNQFTYLFLIIFCCISFINCKSNPEKKTETESSANIIFISPLGKEFTKVAPTQKMLDLYAKAKQDFENNPNDVENIIWYGRRTAYLAKYKDAIEIYSEGIKKFPKSAKLYRHRGHRYISLRMYDKAIEDYLKAVELIKGTENEMEPDGMPNVRNIPVSSLHGNIWYHLGLAYYLKHDYQKSFDAYLNCRNSGNYDDNIVSSTHWLYMNQRRLGNEVQAEKVLEPIKENADIIENMSYYDLCKFYKNIIPIDSIQGTKGGTPSSDAVKYGLASWYLYNNKKDKAKTLFEEIINTNAYSSFGYLAAESDLIYYYNYTN